MRYLSVMSSFHRFNNTMLIYMQHAPVEQGKNQFERHVKKGELKFRP